MDDVHIQENFPMHASSEPFKPFIDRWRASPFFGALNEESLATFVAQIKQINFHSGQTIFREGEPSQGLYWLQSGTLKAVKYSAAGKEQILHFTNPGDTFNEVGAFSTLPNPAVRIPNRQYSSTPAAW